MNTPHDPASICCWCDDCLSQRIGRAIMSLSPPSEVADARQRLRALFFPEVVAAEYSGEALELALKRLSELQEGLARLLGSTPPWLHEPAGNDNLLSLLGQRLAAPSRLRHREVQAKHLPRGPGERRSACGGTSRPGAELDFATSTLPATCPTCRQVEEAVRGGMSLTTAIGTAALGKDVAHEQEVQQLRHYLEVIHEMLEDCDLGVGVYGAGVIADLGMDVGRVQAEALPPGTRCRLKPGASILGLTRGAEVSVVLDVGDDRVRVESSAGGIHDVPRTALIVLREVPNA